MVYGAENNLWRKFEGKKNTISKKEVGPGLMLAKLLCLIDKWDIRRLL